VGIQPETVRDMCTLALKEAGVLGLGQTANAEDINDTFTLLNRMLAQWQVKRWVVPSLYDIAAVANGAVSNPIGPGQFWNATRPNRIQAAYFIQNIAGSLPSNSNAVSCPLTEITSYEKYAAVALKQLPAWPQFFFYDNAFPNGNVFIWPIPDSTYTIHLILKSPIGFTIEIETGEISNGGNLYTNGVYTGVPLVNLTGYGSGTTADITVAGNAVTSVVIDQPGNGYNINDQLTLNAALIGGTGSGFVYTVTDVTDDLDAVMNMPPEYYEAIHYNLTLRVMSAYNYQADPFRSALAKGALNTIRVANSQIPTLSMPAGYRNKRGSNFYIYNADAR
jgi:hypothetical protein